MTGGTSRRSAAMARLAWIVTILAIAVSIPLSYLDVHGHLRMPTSPTNALAGVVLAAIILTIATFGMLIVARFPGNAIGWLFGITGLVFALIFPAGALAVTHGLLYDLPGRDLAVWYANVAQGPNAFCPFIFLLLLFPNGRSLGPRWRPLIWIAAAVTVAAFLVTGLVPGPLSNYPSVVNPIGIGFPTTVFNVTLSITFVGELALIAAGALSFGLRFRRSRGEERLQLKWLLSAAVFLAVIMISGPVLWSLPAPVWPIALMTGVAALLIAVGVSMLKYRLYEIDLIINRALVYGSLTASLAALYVAGVIGVQAVLRALTGQSSELAVAIVTLAIAALFNPWRHRLQRFIDRRFYRQRYDAVRALSSFQTKLRDNVDLEVLSADLASVVSQTVQPSSIALWFAPEEAP